MKSKIPGLCALVASIMLAGCGESTNIEASAGDSVTSCSSLLGVTCVTGRFIDDAAVNVNYECGLTGSGTVRSFTADDGSFICPDGSVATFSLQNPEDPELRITLGQVTVTRPAQVYGENSVFPVYFYVTPRHLAGDVGSTISTRALNITRLLQTLSNDTRDDDLSRNLPTRRVLIDDADKLKINATVFPEAPDFSKAIDPDPLNPSEGSFDFQVKDFLQSLDDTSKHELITGQQAAVALQKAVFSSAAGVYSGGSFIAFSNDLALVPSFDPVDIGAMVGRDVGAGKDFVGFFTLLVDRRGRMVGSGVYSYGSGSQWTVWSDPKAMVLTATGTEAAGAPAWPIDGNLTQMRMSLLGNSDRFVRIDNGLMRREAIAGSDNIYTRLFSENPNPDAIGQWSLVDANEAPYISDGNYTLERTLAAATFMNPAVWEDGGADFPLPITVTLYNADLENAGCAGGIGCEIAKLRMVVLEDGNLITDRFGSCGVDVDADTLVVAGNPANVELPLGLVANSLDTLRDESATLKVMTLLAMLPDDARLVDAMTIEPGFEEYIPHIQFGSNLGTDSLLRINSGAGQYNLYGNCSGARLGQGACSDSTIDTFQPGLGSWLNGYTFMRYNNANQATVPPSNTEDLLHNSGGLMSAVRTPGCPVVP